jgi:long-chain acyl-CoA synthetase
MNLATNLTHSANTHPDRVAVRLGEQKTTYRGLGELSRQVAGLLAERGVRAGDRVGIVLPNIPEFAAVYYGVLHAGAVVVPMNPLLKAREVAYYLADSGVGVIFTSPMSAAEVRAAAATAGAQTIVVDATFAEMLSTAAPVDGVVDRDGADTAVILYTSGTTGTPKGAELTHANLSRNAQVLTDQLLQLTAADVIFAAPTEPSSR